jgi:hypothetical protein
VTALYNPANFGCIDRDTFQLKPSTRTVLTAGDIPRRVVKTGDVMAPLEASFTSSPTDKQYGAFWQWVKFDLAGAALPFLIDLYLWNAPQRVRARFIGPLKAQRVDFTGWVVSGVFEIERESVTPP